MQTKCRYDAQCVVNIEGIISQNVYYGAIIRNWSCKLKHLRLLVDVNDNMYMRKS